MTDDKKKHDDKDRKKVSDEELEDVAGGTGRYLGSTMQAIEGPDAKKKGDSGAVDHNSSRSNNG